MSEVYSLGEVSYQKWQVYEELGWGDETNVGDYFLCGAPFGGPVAMLKDDKSKKSSGQQIANEPKPKMLIFTSSGNKLAEVVYNISIINFIYFFILHIDRLGFW